MRNYLLKQKNTFVYLFFLSFFIGQSALSGESEFGDNKQNAMLRFKLKAQDSYIVGQPVAVTFMLENLTDKDVYVLTWYTPFEGMNGKIFSVTREGIEIPYKGRMVKRGEPVRKDYLHITPLGSASEVLDLATAYNMNTPGEYHVEFIKPIYDLTFDEKTIPRKQAEHRGAEISGNTLNFRVISH
jgi:hypothetical protein